jgi:hypothetical protein
MSEMPSSLDHRPLSMQWHCLVFISNLASLLHVFQQPLLSKLLAEHDTNSDSLKYGTVKCCDILSRLALFSISLVYPSPSLPYKKHNDYPPVSGR